MTGQPLAGGVANAGLVVRDGDDVVRPSNAHSASIHAFLAAIRAAGFEGASRPVAIDPDGRERLEFIEGDVALTPYPDWAQTGDALASVAVLLRELHRASASFDPSAMTWSAEFADPDGGPIVCHNDLCLENIVFRDGRAIGFVDFDFAAPGRAVYDVAQFARMCVPVDDDLSAERVGWQRADRPERLRLAADAYGLDASGREELLEAIDDSIARGGEFLRRRVAAGDVNFTRMWHEIGGMERFDRRRRWWASSGVSFAAALR